MLRFRKVAPRLAVEDLRRACVLHRCAGIYSRSALGRRRPACDLHAYAIEWSRRICLRALDGVGKPLGAGETE